MKLKWKHEYKEEDLIHAVGYVGLKGVDVLEMQRAAPKDWWKAAKDLVEFVGYKMVKPKDLSFNRHPWSSAVHQSEGWGKNLTPEQLESAYNRNHERNLWTDEYLSKPIAPPIVIDNQIGDGMGRLMLAHALGEEALIAKFKSKSFKKQVESHYRIVADTFKVGDTFTFDEVVKVAKKFGNPDILHGSKFSGRVKPEQMFKLERIPLSKLHSGKSKSGKTERPKDVMFWESGPEYDDDGNLTGGDEYYAQEFAKDYPSGDTAGPIIVDKDGSEFEILDGRHRARAAFLRGEKDIRAFVPVERSVHASATKKPDKTLTKGWMVLQLFGNPLGKVEYQIRVFDKKSGTKIGTFDVIPPEMFARRMNWKDKSWWTQITISNAYVHYDWQRKGVATAAYDWAEKLSKAEVVPYETYDDGEQPMSRDAREFWRKRTPGVEFYKDEEDEDDLGYQVVKAKSVSGTGISDEDMLLIANWIDQGGSTPTEAYKMGTLKVPPKYRKVSGKVYRGVSFDNDDLAGLGGTYEGRGIESWTSDFDVAHRFAADSDLDHKFVLEVKPTSSQVIINLGALLEDDKVKEQMQRVIPNNWEHVYEMGEGEGEVLLKNVKVKLPKKRKT